MPGEPGTFPQVPQGPDLHRLLGERVVVGRRESADSPTSGEHGHRHLFRVIATVGGTLSLRPEDVDARTFCRLLAEGDRLVLTHALPNGALQGDITVDRWSPSGRVLTAHVPGTLRAVQRRASYRVPVGHRLLLACARDGHIVIEEATTVDVSIAGLGCTTKARLHEHELLGGFLITPVGTFPLVLQVVEAAATVRGPTHCRIVEVAPTDLRMLTMHLRRTEVARIGTVPSELRDS